MIDLKLVLGAMHHVGDFEPALQVRCLTLQHRHHFHDAVVFLLGVHACHVQHDVFLFGHLDQLELLPAQFHGVGQHVAAGRVVVFEAHRCKECQNPRSKMRLLLCPHIP